MKSCFYKVVLFLSTLLIGTSLQAQIISTHAGTYGSISSTGDGGPATAASAGNPNGVAVDRHGNVFFSDGTNHVIRKVNAAGVISTVAGNGTAGYSGDGGAATSASLNFPQGLCVDTTGNIYIADEVNRVIRKVTTSGIISTVVGTGAYGTTGDGGPATAATLPSAVDVAIDRNGNLYIADGYYSVRKVNTSGIISTFAGIGYGYTGDGGMADTATFNNPLGVDVDTFGNVYISDNQNMVIRKVDNSGIISTYAGNGAGAGMGMGGSYSGDGGPAVAAGLDQPYGITVSPNGDLYIADQYNSLIRYVNASTGTITRYAGNMYLAYSGDGGMADTAGLNFPVDAAVDASGNLYIADINNNVIRKVKAPYTIVISATNDTVCARTPVTFTSVVTGPTTSYHYHWFVNTTAVGGDSATYAADSMHNGDIVKCVLIGGASDTLTISNTIVMTVNPVLTPTISISSSTSASICSGISVTYSSTITGGGTSPAYHWSVNGTDVGTSSTYTYTPNNGDVIQARLNSSYPCITASVAFSNTIVMTVTPTAIPSITIATASDTVCTSTSVLYTATIVNGGTAPHYQWFRGGTTIGSDTSAIHYTPSSGDVISCRLTTNAVCRSTDTIRSNYITMFVTSAVTPTISISVRGGDSSCTGMVDTIVATTTSAGASATYDWFVNGIYATSGNPFIHSPTSGEIVHCILTPGGCSTVATVMSNTRLLTVLSYTTPSVTVAASADTVCAGGSVTFTPTPTYGGSAPVYRWFKNGTYVSTGATYTDAPTSTDTYYGQLISNARCNTTDTAYSSTRSIVVNPLVTPSVSITASPAGAVCAGTSVTYTAVPVSGGAAPTYRWYKGTTFVGTGATYTTVPVNGDTISCQLTSTYACVTGAVVMSPLTIMVVNPVVTPSVTVASAPGDTVCAGTAITFTASPVNGGTSPAYQWLNGSAYISGATNVTYTYTPSAGDVIFCRLTSSNPCAVPDTAFSTPHALLVNPIVTPSVTVTASPSIFVCVGTTVTFTATGANGGSAPAFEWRKNGIAVSGATSSTYAYVPSNGDIITCKYTSNAPCRTTDSAFSTPITMTVDPIAAPSVTIAGTYGDTICVGMAITFTPTPTIGGSAPTYKWYTNGVLSGTGSTLSYTPTAGDVVYVVMHSSSSCATPDSATSSSHTISVSSYVTPAVSIATPNDTVCSGTPATFTPTPVNGGFSPVYNWYVNGSLMGTGSTFTYSPVAGDVVKSTLYSSHPCATPDTAVSNSITMSTIPSVTPSVTVAATPGTSVAYGTSVTFTATAVNGGSAPVFIWLLNGGLIVGTTGNIYVTDTLKHNDQVTCVLLSNATCANPPFDTSNVSIINITNVGVVNVNSNNSAIALEPNPNNGSFILHGTAIETADNTAQVIITDMLGKAVYQNKVEVVNNKINSNIALDNNLANGLYLLNVKYTEGNKTLHFVIEK